jgi:CHAT domain-containing protein/tetratricopeptide (TPR) repeat protein
MKAFRIAILIVLTTLTVVGRAQDFFAYTDSLFKAGNVCYAEIGNKLELDCIIKAYQKAIDQGRKNGLLSEKTADSLTYLQLYKLFGDYHYLNSDVDEESYAKAETYFKAEMDFAQSDKAKGYQTVYHDQYILHQELGQLYYKWGKYQEAYEEMERALEEVSKYYSPYDDEVLDQLGQLAICRARIAQNEADFDDALDEIQFVIDEYQNTSTESYGEALRKKGKILMLRRERLGTSDAGEALKCYKKYFEIKRADALAHFATMNAEQREQYWMRIRPFVVDCSRLEDVDAAFIYDVVLFSKGLTLEYSLNKNPKQITWQQVQNKLQTNDCAIEFVQYESNDTKQLGALVLHKKGEPQFARIGCVEDIKHTPLKEGGTIGTAIAVDDHRMKDRLYSDTTAFSVIWTNELLDAIGDDTQRIFFAPDGIIHQIAIEYMLAGYDIYRLTSTRQLLNKPSQRAGDKILIVGNVNFNKASCDYDTDDADNDGTAYLYLKSMNVQVDPLPGTKVETDTIVQRFDEMGLTTEILSDTAATEARFASAAGDYSYIHLSTHGYYVGETPEGTDLMPAAFDESMSQNGLILAGVNTALQTDGFDLSWRDGILSAREISQLDLSNTDVVILSACHSGQGYLTDDGVYGIQRGLKNAGVKAMIVSLWSVDDRATARLMRSFYSYLRTDDIHTAFMKARNDLINADNQEVRRFDPARLAASKASNMFDKPQYYDAFILIDIF